MLSSWPFRFIRLRCFLNLERQRGFLFFAMFILGFCGLLFLRCILARCAKNVAASYPSSRNTYGTRRALCLDSGRFAAPACPRSRANRVSRKIAEIKPLSSRVKASTTFGVMTPVFISFQLKRCNAAGGFARSRRSAGCACFSLAPGGRALLAAFGRQAVVMGRFDQEQAACSIAASGDRALPAACPLCFRFVAGQVLLDRP